MLTFEYDGRTVEGQTACEVVAAMSQRKLVPARSLPRYRRAVVRRAMSAGILGIEAKDNSTFLRTLCVVGLLAPSDQATYEWVSGN